jgi:hypothetical protein
MTKNVYQTSTSTSNATSKNCLYEHTTKSRGDLEGSTTKANAMRRRLVAAASEHGELQAGIKNVQITVTYKDWVRTYLGSDQ